MLRLLSDQNFNGSVIDGLLRRQPDLDIVRVHDVGLAAATDPEILEWAATQNRILLSHDIETVPFYAYQRIGAELPMPGVLIIHRMTVAKAIEEILIVAVCGDEDDIKDQVKYLPM